MTSVAITPVAITSVTITPVTISLPDSLMQFVATQAANKGYGDIRDYIRSLLREAQAREEEDARLEALLLEGPACGYPMPRQEVGWKDLKAMTENMVDEIEGARL